MTLIRKGVLTKSGWYDYPDGPEYKDPLELQKAARVMPSIPIIPHHPDGMYANDASTVIGRALNHYDHQGQAINTTYEFWEDRLTPEQSQAVRTQQIDVSPGFTCDLEVYSKGHKQTNVLLNHAAVLFEGEGRCPKEEGCGVLDEKTNRVDRVGPTIRADPFAGFESFDACVKEQMAKGKDAESAQKICGELKAQHEPKADVLPVKSDATITYDGVSSVDSNLGVLTVTEEKTDELETLKAKVTELQKKLDAAEELVKPMHESLVKSLTASGITKEDIDGKSFTELMLIKKGLDAAQGHKTDTVLPPPTQLAKPELVKAQPIGNVRYKYQDKLRKEDQ